MATWEGPIGVWPMLPKTLTQRGMAHLGGTHRHLAADRHSACRPYSQRRSPSGGWPAAASARDGGCRDGGRRVSGLARGMLCRRGGGDRLVQQLVHNEWCWCAWMMGGDQSCHRFLGVHVKQEAALVRHARMRPRGSCTQGPPHVYICTALREKPNGSGLGLHLLRLRQRPPLSPTGCAGRA